MGYLSLVNTEVNWLLRAFALSRSFVIGLSFTLRVGMPMFSHLFALMNDQNRLGFVFRLSLIWLCYIGFVGSCQWVIPCQINQWFASHPSDFDESWHMCR